MRNPGSDAGVFVFGYARRSGIDRHSGARRSRAPGIHFTACSWPITYVYLLASKKYGTLYIGVTNDIVRRIHEHKSKVVAGFSKRYGVDRLVWFEIYDDPVNAIKREKELKKWRREWKVRLIEEKNP